MAATLTALALSACGEIYPSSEPAQGPANGVKANVDEVVVGFAQQQLQAPYFAAMEVQSKEIADEQGFKLLFQAANKDPVIQMNQMQAMIAQGADVLVVNATSVKGQKQMMTQIASQIPVTYIDTSVPGTGMTSVQSDNLTIGRESGKLTAKRFLDAGKKSITMVILTGPATDEFVGPNRRQGFLDGLKEGGLPYEIKAEQAGDYQQDKGQVAAENMLAANPDIDLILGLNDSMALGAYNVINGKDKYKNVYVAASADGQKEALALIKKGGCEGRYISTGLNSPVPGRRGSVEDLRRRGHRQDQTVGLPEGVLHRSRRHRLRQHRQVLRPQQRLLTPGSCRSRTTAPHPLGERLVRGRHLAPPRPHWMWTETPSHDRLGPSEYTASSPWAATAPCDRAYGFCAPPVRRVGPSPVQRPPHHPRTTA